MEEILLIVTKEIHRRSSLTVQTPSLEAQDHIMEIQDIETRMDVHSSIMDRMSADPSMTEVLDIIIRLEVVRLLNMIDGTPRMITSIVKTLDLTNGLHILSTITGIPCRLLIRNIAFLREVCHIQIFQIQFLLRNINRNRRVVSDQQPIIMNNRILKKGLLRLFFFLHSNIF